MNNVISTNGAMTLYSVRLHRGDDLLLSIKELAQEKHIRAGVVLSAVGCVLQARLRDASGVNIRDIEEREKHEKYLSKKADVLGALCEERGIKLWEK